MSKIVGRISLALILIASESTIYAQESVDIVRLEYQGRTSERFAWPNGTLYSLYLTVDATTAYTTGTSRGETNYLYKNAVKSVTGIVANQTIDLEGGLADTAVVIWPESKRIGIAGGYTDGLPGFSVSGTFSNPNSVAPTHLKSTLLSLNANTPDLQAQFFNGWKVLQPVSGVTRSFSVTQITSPMAQFTDSWSSPGGPEAIFDAKSVQARFNGNSFTFGVEIGYQSNKPLKSNLLASYESGIERAWNNKRFITVEGIRYPIIFDASFVENALNPNASIKIVDGSCHSNVEVWCTLDPDGFAYDSATIAAHEFGHIIGLRDEYWYTDKIVLPATGINLSFLDLFNGNICKGLSTKIEELSGEYCESIMAKYGGSVYADRLFKHVEDYLTQKIARPGAVFGWAPEIDDPYYPSISPIGYEEHISSVPESNTRLLMLMGAGLAIVLKLSQTVRGSMRNFSKWPESENAF